MPDSSTMPTEPAPARHPGSTSSLRTANQRRVVDVLRGRSDDLPADGTPVTQAELARITDVQHGKAYESYQDFISKSQLEHVPSLEDYSVSNRGLRPGFAGTPSQVADRIREFEDAGVDTLLLQFSPQLEEMDRFGEQVIPLVRQSVGAQS